MARPDWRYIRWLLWIQTWAIYLIFVAILISSYFTGQCCNEVRQRSPQTPIYHHVWNTMTYWTKLYGKQYQAIIEYSTLHKAAVTRLLLSSEYWDKFHQDNAWWRHRITTKYSYTVWYCYHDDVIKWKHFPRNWPFVRGIHRSPVNSPHKGQWREALMFSLICVWINDWVNNHGAGDLRR